MSNQRADLAGRPPVFVVGARRTGTTLLYQAMCTGQKDHPFLPEFQFLTRILQAISFADGSWDQFTSAVMTRETFDDYCQTIVARLLQIGSSSLPSHVVPVFKNPELSLVINYLASLVPRAKFVVSVRNPLDQISSELEAAGRQFQQGMRNDPNPPVSELAANYQAYYTPIIATADAQPSRFSFVRYEDFVVNPMETLAKIGSFAGTDFSNFDPSAAWSFGRLKVEHARQWPSWTPHYGQPVTAGRIGRHEGTLGPDDIAAARQSLRALIERFGYQS